MASLEYKKVILEALAGALAPAGFRRNGSVFKRDQIDVVHLISLQSSTESMTSSLRVTVNVAVWAESLADERARPDVSASQWHERIGFLMPARQDRWWVARSDAEARIVAAEMRDTVVKYGLPALDAISSTVDLSTLWKSNRSPGLTAVQAQRYLARLREREAEANKPPQTLTGSEAPGRV